MSVICDTTVLSNFSRVGQLDLLRRLFGDVHIAPEVYREVEAALEQGYAFYAGIARLTQPPTADGWLRLTAATEAESALAGSLPPRLHAGEAPSLAIAQTRGWLFLTDDRTARYAAASRGIPLSGSIGVLVLAVRSGLGTVEAAHDWLAAIIRAGCFAPVTDLASLI